MPTKIRQYEDFEVKTGTLFDHPFLVKTHETLWKLIKDEDDPAPTDK